MKIRKICVSLLALLLVLACLSSCAAIRESFDLLWSSLSGEGRALVPFSRITYHRPDYEAIDVKIDEMSELLKSGKGKEAKLTSLLEEIVTAYYYDVYTMGSLAFVLYAKDITDEDLRSEYYDITAEIDRLGARLNELYHLCAASAFKDAFEKKVMGEGFFDDYAGGDFTYSEEFLALLEEESELLQDYSRALSEVSVQYDDNVYTLEDIEAITDTALYEAVVSAYYDKYNAYLGKLFVKLVSVRQQISDYCGYRNYASYAFENLYAREYEVIRAERYITGVKKHLAPIYAAASAKYAEQLLTPLPSMEPRTTADTAASLIAAMSRDLGGIYDEMIERKLYTVAASGTMYYGSFQTYFNQFESPYLFVNGTGQISDLLTVVHEFGHFASAYYNYGVTGSNDESEVASQGLELLSLRYLDTVLGQEEADALRTYELYSILANLTECAAYTEFENMVYADRTPTLSEINRYFHNCAAAYGLIDPRRAEMDDTAYWVFINHLFEYPYYMIGYSVSAGAAVQLYELGKDEGMERYIELIQRADLQDFFGNLEEVGLQSPLNHDMPEKLADFFEKEFELTEG